jgi:leucyl-tRNA synthetase
VNGKLRAQVTVAADAGKDEVLAAARAAPNVAAHLDGRIVAKEIFVPGRLVNLVVREG